MEGLGSQEALLVSQNEDNRAITWNSLVPESLVLVLSLL